MLEEDNEKQKKLINDIMKKLELQSMINTKNEFLQVKNKELNLILKEKDA